MIKRHLRIKGMHCDSCANTIRHGLRAAEGVAAASVNHEAGDADVIFDEKRTNIESLLARVRQLGFEADEAST